MNWCIELKNEKWTEKSLKLPGCSEFYIKTELIIQIETLSTTSYLMMFPNFGVSYLEWMEWVASILNIYILKCYIELVNI